MNISSKDILMDKKTYDIYWFGSGGGRAILTKPLSILRLVSVKNLLLIFKS